MSADHDAPMLSPSSSDEQIDDHQGQITSFGTAADPRVKRKLEAMKRERERERRFDSLIVSRSVLEGRGNTLRITNPTFPLPSPITPISPNSLLGLNIPLDSIPTCVRIRHSDPPPRPPKSSNGSSTASSPNGQSYIPFPTLPPLEMTPRLSTKKDTSPTSPAKTSAWWAIT